ncbi:hypothetical protein Y590_24960 [Methylobacterium sp. AMS5]|nr:hypothetical protein Y590_24960 [Methylobacterium sp. AMS5]
MKVRAIQMALAAEMTADEAERNDRMADALKRMVAAAHST